MKTAASKMEVVEGNQELSFHDDDNDHEKTYVTVHADSFNEKDFNNLLNCLDKIHESENKRRSGGKVIKNYCVQVPYIDNSMLKDDDDDDDGAGKDFDRTCDEMKNNISQMFSYFDEDVQLNYDDYDKLDKWPCDAKRDKRHKPSESFREKFLRNRRKIKELGEAQAGDSKPKICGLIKKPNAPATPTNSLNKNQVDKIMNEFNRVKINYYSKDNFVEFTNIDYFYCDSDRESVRSEKVGKLRRNVLTKFEQEIRDKGRKSPSSDTEVVPKNSVRDKISMFSKLDMIIQPCDGTLTKTSTAPAIMTNTQQTFIKNSSSANKNQNKCFIKDINNSLLHQVKKDDEPSPNQDGDDSKSSDCSNDLLEKIASYAKLNDANLLMKLERIVNKFRMSLLHTIDSLMNDDAFTLVGRRMRHLSVETRPSLERFNETFDGERIDASMKNAELSVVGSNRIQLQILVDIVNRATMEKDRVKINVIFMAQYETDGCVVPPADADDVKNTFFIFFMSLFEVEA